jgi:hypothetical protein
MAVTLLEATTTTMICLEILHCHQNLLRDQFLLHGLSVHVLVVRIPGTRITFSHGVKPMAKCVLDLEDRSKP